MKIGLNTYSFRKEVEKERSMNLEDLWKIVKKIGLIEGIELLDRHIPGWPDGDLKAGVKQVKEQVDSYNWKLYALGPHLKMFQITENLRKKEIEDYKRWIDLAADNGIPQLRSQVSGPRGFLMNISLKIGIKMVSSLLDRVLPYAEERNVKIGIETHWGYSSWPPFLEAITEKYKESPALGINFDWGNFWDNKARFEALDIAVRPYNHCHNHVKIFNFGENFQSTNNAENPRRNYDTYEIVQRYKKNDFKNYFSIEFEGSQPTLEGVYKSVHALKYAITDGVHKIDPNFDWNTLME